MVNKKSLATFVRTLGNQVIAGFKHFLNNVKVGGDLIISPDSLGTPATNVLTVDGSGVVKTATAFTGISVDSVSKVKHEVKAGVAINKGQAVYVTGADGTNMIVGLASNASEATSSKTMGLSESTLAINGKGNVVTEGLLDGLDTTGATAGDPVWLGTGGNLIYGLANKPYAPAHLVFIGIVTRVNANNGEIFVKVQNGFELNEIHDVDLKTNVPVNGEILGFNGTLWVNKTIAGWLGYTPANASGTTNYVSKFTGTTTLGNSQIFDNGTNVGIGTASPNEKLHASGNIHAYAAGGINAGLFASTSAGSTTIALRSNGVTHFNGGNVGIGTTSPAGYAGRILDIGGASTVSLNFHTTTSGSTQNDGATLYYGSDNSLRIVNYESDGIVRIDTQDTERMRITSGGNVGIGTTSPSQKLDVSGYITSQRYYPYSSGSTYIAGDTAGLTVEGSGYFYVFPSAGSYFQGIARFRGGISNDTASYLQINGGSSNVTYFNGTVGIGTTAPSTLLHISGTGNTFTRYTNTTNAGHFMDVGSNSSGQHFIFGYGAYPMLFGTNGSEVMRITSGGNVGIGTTSPYGRLELSGSGQSWTTAPAIRMWDSFNSKGWLIGNVNNITAGDFYIRTLPSVSGDPGSGQQEFTIKHATGNVGIGTTSPSDKLHIVGNVNVDGYKVYNGSSNNSAGFELNGSRFNIHGYYGITFNSSSAGIGSQTERMRITPDGNVGIGTTSPATKLHVDGTIITTATLNSTAGSYSIDHPGINTWKIGITSTNGSTFHIGNDIGGSFANKIFSITAGGNVGIGTTSPSQKLEVSGTIRGEVVNVYGSTDPGSTSPYLFSPSTGALGVGANGSERLRITSAGNVGIGTTSPTAKLEIAGTTSTLALSFGNSVPNNPLFINTYGGWSGIGMDQTTAGVRIVGDYSSRLVDIGYYNGGTVSHANWISRLIVLNTGNVGIGTTAPGYVLDVIARASGEGGVRFWNNRAATSTIDSIALHLNVSNSVGMTGGKIVVAENTTDSWPTNMQFYINSATSSYSPTEAMRITSAGNVGIGTTSPSSLLEIAGASPVLTINRTSGTSSTINFNSSGNNFASIISNPSNGENRFSIGPAAAWGGFHTFYTDTSERMRITAAGNVGIGTTSPTYKLNVVSNAVAGKQNLATIDRTAQNFVTFTNPQYSTDASMGLLLRVFPQSDARQGAGIIASGGANNATTDLDLFVTTSPDGLGGTSYSAIKINGLNGNVGIGTTTPGAKLDVVGNTYIRSGILYVDTIASYSTTNVSLASATNLIIPSGNLGIGTTSPAAKLDVIGNIRSSNAFISQGGNLTWTGGAVFMDWQSTYGRFGAYNYTTNAWTPIDLNGGSIYITGGNGNVGIGTTGPGAKLDVIGNARATTLSTTSGLGLNVGAYAYLSQTISGVMTFLGHNVRASDTVANTAVVQNSGWISSLIKMYYNEGITFHTDTTTYAAGATYPLSTTERMRIQTNGNVGIGTSSPFSRLTVSGALSASTSQMSIVNTEGGHAIVRAGISGVSNNGISFVTANVDGSSQNVRMVVSATGSVGIGTTSPSASLHIASTGGVIFGATAGSVGTSQITTQNPVSPVSSRFAFGTDGTGWQYRIAKNTAGTIVDLVTVADSGNVGIGTTSPGHLLDVAGTGRFIQTTATPLTVYRTSVSSNVGIRFQNDTTSWYAGLASDDAFGISFNNANLSAGQVKITTTGNVGIGTSNPTAAISVVRGTGVNAYIELAGNNNTIGTTSMVYGQDGGNSGYVWNRANAPIYFGTTGSTRMFLSAAGDFGIGTTSPSAKLHVIGNATVSATLSTANAKISGTLADSFNQVGTAGQVLSSTGTGIEWVTGGGGGGGSTIIVKDEGTTIGSSFTTLNFVGDNVSAGASGSTAVIEVTGRASSGSVYYEDVATPFIIPGGGFADVEINTQTVVATVPSSLTGSNKLMATITFGVSNVSNFEVFNGFKFRLYNVSPMSDVQGTTHSWNAYMSKDEGCTTTVFTFHIPIDPSVVAGGDTIVVQADALTNYTPEIYYCALTLMEGTN